MSGSIPRSFTKTQKQSTTESSPLGLDNYKFKGVYPLAKHRMIAFTSKSNQRLCGMVPVNVRFAHGLNFYNTGLGMPCPEEISNGLDRVKTIYFEKTFRRVLICK